MNSARGRMGLGASLCAVGFVFVFGVLLLLDEAIQLAKSQCRACALF